MRTITVKYAGECRKCGTPLREGDAAAYEKSMGIFCPGCAPTDTEEIRKFRQAKADAKADRYDMWAAKRREKASAQLNSYPDIRHDWAFITQPGHIPFRARMNAADARACESLNKADEMQRKADNLRHVRVKGDKEREYEARREAVRGWIEVGMTVDTVIWGRRVVAKINKKTISVEGASGTIPMEFLRQVKEA